MTEVRETREEMSRRSFFKLGASGLAAALLFVSGCAGGEEGDEDEDEGGGY